MKKILTFIVLAFSTSLTINGQNQILEKINEIKSQKDVYYWGQYTHPDEDTAIAGAAKSVLIDVNIQRRNNHLPEETVEWLLPKVKHIKINRGNLVRVFSYVKILDVQSVGQTSIMSKTENAPAIEGTPSFVNPSAKEFVPDAFTQKIIDRKDFQSVYKFMKEQKTLGQILQFGPLKDVEEYGSLDLILFDLESKELISILSQETGVNKRMNLMTGMPDSLDNYPEDMVAVIWYIK